MNIRKANTVVITQTKEDFEGVETLVIYRQAPYRFSLKGAIGVTSPFEVYLNTTYTKEGAKGLIEYIKALAIEGQEVWSNSQLIEASQAKTLYIVYVDFNNISLNFSKDILTKEEIEEKNEGANVWVSYDISDAGLINLVDEFLNWL